MDHPGVVTHLAVLDSVPVAEALARTDPRFAAAWWHWFFFAQPDKPERAILADPAAWYGAHAPGKVAAPGEGEPRRPPCGDPLAVWADWTTDLRGGAPIDSGHHMAEDAPEELAAEPGLFLAM